MNGAMSGKRAPPPAVAADVRRLGGSSGGVGRGRRTPPFSHQCGGMSYCRPGGARYGDAGLQLAALRSLLNCGVPGDPPQQA